MMSIPKRVKHYVLVARPRIETAIVEVEATGDDDAEQQALVAAARLPADAWSRRRFNRAEYRPHVETLIAEDELADEGGPHQLDRERAAELLGEIETRYLLLMTTEDRSEGDLLLQPWFVTERPDLLASDLTRDWIASLEHLGITHLSERLDDLSAGEPPMPSDRILFAAPRPRKRRKE